MDHRGQSFSRYRDRLIELSGLPPNRFHNGHHEAESLALAVGVALKALQAVLGHSLTRMTAHTYQTGAARDARCEGLSLLGSHRFIPGE
jgi:integrase